jgi:hypothetical protein
MLVSIFEGFLSEALEKLASGTFFGSLFRLALCGEVLELVLGRDGLHHQSGKHWG